MEEQDGGVGRPQLPRARVGYAARGGGVRRGRRPGGGARRRPRQAIPFPVVTMGSPSVSGDMVRLVEAYLRKKAEGVVDKVRRLCVANLQVQRAVEVADGPLGQRWLCTAHTSAEYTSGCH